ncbi:MAG: ribosome biogenesis GTPase YlqF, partial [Clostridia bacterium]|nr:ribosome biogenesis GTPase YlqF [Clostridia bacterium]
MPSEIIQWFPGHMAKTRREIGENLKNVDFVIELLDARIPKSSENPEIARICGDKPRLTLLSHSALADPKYSTEW